MDDGPCPRRWALVAPADPIGNTPEQAMDATARMDQIPKLTIHLSINLGLGNVPICDQRTLHGQGSRSGGATRWCEVRKEARDFDFDTQDADVWIISPL